MHPKPCADTSSPCEPSFILSTLPPIINSLLNFYCCYYYYLLPLLRFSQAVEEAEDRDINYIIWSHYTYTNTNTYKYKLSSFVIIKMLA